MTERDPISDEIHDLLRQPMGRLASAAAFGWMQRYRTRALEVALAGATREEREAGVKILQAELLDRLRHVLPDIIRLECRYDRDVSEAQHSAEQTYRERFEEEVARTLDDPAFDRASTERVVGMELSSFRISLEWELAELVGRHRRQLHEAVRLVLSEID